MTNTQKNVLAKLQDGAIIVTDYKTPSGIKLVTLEGLKKQGYITFERVQALHLRGSNKAYLITKL
jgi:hypothetical protein